MSYFIPGNVVAVDTETTGLDTWKGCRPFGFSFCGKSGETAWFEWPVHPRTRAVLPIRKEWKLVRDFMEDERVLKVFHNAAFDVRMFEAIGIYPAGPGGRLHDGGQFEETMFMAHVHNSMEPRFGLKQLAFKYCSYELDDQKTLQKTVLRLRRVAKKLGWATAYDERGRAATAADYWLPAAFALRQPDLLREGESDVCKEYGVGDAVRTMLLYTFYAERFDEEPNAWDTYRRERDLWAVTYRMVSRGVRLRVNAVAKEVATTKKKLAVQHAIVQRAAWKGFRIRSNPDLGKLFYKRLKLPVTRRTAKTNQPETTFEAFQDHADHPIIKAFFRWRSADKALGTYFQRYEWNAVDDHVPGSRHRILHPDFQQMGPRTGRYACRNPNIQNVPDAVSTRGRGKELIQARHCFGPRDGYVWYHYDYHQMEPRIFADVAQEKFMLQAIAEGRDMHTECANKAWGGQTDPSIRAARIALEFPGTGAPEQPNKAVVAAWEGLQLKATQVARLSQKDQEHLAANWLAQHLGNIVKAEATLGKKTSRANAKLVFFLKTYGGGANALAAFLGVPLPTATQFLADYDVAFPRIKGYQRELTRQAELDGCIRNMYGRKLMVDPDKPYTAVDYMVQGSAADTLKVAMIRTARYLKASGLDAHLVLTIHDEIVFEFLKRHAYWSVLLELKKIMEDHQGHFGVPLPIGIEKTVLRWDRKTKLQLPEVT
jgi:DNA polymerase I-like protein with 3'-5' exonuclease and polymerase domains